MRIGASLTLFAVGAILGLAVHVDNSVINVNLIGLILMLVAIVGFALSPAAAAIQRRTTVTTASRDAGPAEAQKTTEQGAEQVEDTVDHPSWASRPASRPVRGAERAAGAGPRVPQRTDRSWPTAG